METSYEVYVSDTIHGSSERRTYKTLHRAVVRYDHLTRDLRRNGHNTVVLTRRGEGGTFQVYPAPIIGR